jgi:hypothetical protein
MWLTAIFLPLNVVCNFLFLFEAKKSRCDRLDQNDREITKRKASFLSIFLPLTTRLQINMENVIDKELIGYLLLLENEQQEKVLDFIKTLLENEKMNIRAGKSEKAIELGEFKTFENFNSDYKNWKREKSNTR